jgi:hypothetical protein
LGESDVSLPKKAIVNPEILTKRKCESTSIFAPFGKRGGFQRPRRRGFGQLPAVGWDQGFESGSLQQRVGRTPKLVPRPIA